MQKILHFTDDVAEEMPEYVSTYKEHIEVTRFSDKEKNSEESNSEDYWQ